MVGLVVGGDLVIKERLLLLWLRYFTLERQEVLVPKHKHLNKKS